MKERSSTALTRLAVDHGQRHSSHAEDLESDMTISSFSFFSVSVALSAIYLLCSAITTFLRLFCAMLRFRTFHARLYPIRNVFVDAISRVQLAFQSRRFMKQMPFIGSSAEKCIVARMYDLAVEQALPSPDRQLLHSGEVELWNNVHLSVLL